MGKTDEHIRKQEISETTCGPMPIQLARRTNLKKDTKRLGEMAEAAFLSKATTLGFGVSKPWGDSERYDFIVDVKSRIFRVQVKSAHSVSKCSGGGYHIDGGRTRYRDSYTSDEIDMLVAYIVPEDVWYIFPPAAFGTMGGINISTRGKRTTKFEPYREAWHIFQETISKSQ